MKCFKLIVALLLFPMLVAAQQDRRVFITLDLSGSMGGDKYALANYTTQMIATLCDDNDEVHMILLGVEKCLSNKQDKLKVIQKPMGSLYLSGGAQNNTEFGDIIGFNEIYSPERSKQDWLFIVGDGIWGTQNVSFASARLKFEQIIKQGNVNVCYLQTGTSLMEKNDFTQFAETLGVIDIEKSSVDPSTIRKGCEHFAKKILGFSDVPLKMKKSGSQCFVFSIEMPVSGFVVVYQDGVAPENLPNMSSVVSGGNPLVFDLKGTPTTIPLKSTLQEVDLSGNVWRIKPNKPIVAGTEIEICFDKNIDMDNVNVYPFVEDIEFGSIGLTPKQMNLKQLDDNTFSICRDESSATVRVELNEKSKLNLSENLLKETVVIVKANNKEYEAKYKDGGFECKIDLVNDETQYYAECDCPGYFKRVTPIMTIEKGDCDPSPTMKVTEREVKDLGSLNFEELKNGPLVFTISDQNTQEILDPNKFDFDVVVENGFLYEEPTMRKEGDEIYIDLHPKGEWCECLFPEDINFKVISTPKGGAFEDEVKQYSQNVQPFHISVEKNGSWLERCLWTLFLAVGMLLLFLYLRALLKKNRFKKFAKVTPAYIRVTGGRKNLQSQSPTYLRERGIGPWINRWFNPFVDERRNWECSSPKTGPITFVASESREIVNITKESLKESMSMAGYKSKYADKDEKMIPVTGKISVYLDKTKLKQEGTLSFDAGTANDEGGYRLFIGIIMAVDIASFLVLLFYIVRATI